MDALEALSEAQLLLVAGVGRLGVGDFVFVGMGRKLLTDRSSDSVELAVGVAALRWKSQLGLTMPPKLSQSAPFPEAQPGRV